MKRRSPLHRSRRKFLKDAAVGSGSIILSAPLWTFIHGCSSSSSKPKVTPTATPTQAPSPTPTTPPTGCTYTPPTKQKLGVALLGVGYYARYLLAPALQQTQHCELKGLITSKSSSNWSDVKTQYGLLDQNIYTYTGYGTALTDTLDGIANNADIDIVYVVTPTFRHKEFAVRAAQLGKHVICEKPMAMTVAECDAMIAASANACRKLSIGYRLRFDPFNQRMIELGQGADFGSISLLDTINGYNGSFGNTNWRVIKSKSGGGPLTDMGVYCVQGLRYTTGLEPTHVRVTDYKNPTDFGVNNWPMENGKTVEAAIKWQMHFPGGLVATAHTYYLDNALGATSKLYMEKRIGMGAPTPIELNPAYFYSPSAPSPNNGAPRVLKINGATQAITAIYEQVAQLDDFAQAIKDNRASPVPGEMGRQDIKIIEAVYRSHDNGDALEVV